MFDFLKKKRIRVSLPKGVRVIAIGDIHGQKNRLDDLMQKVDAYRNQKPVADDQLVFLGDYADRGPHSAPVIEYLINRRKVAKKNKQQEYFLKGNHEELLVCSINGETKRDDVWWRNGAKQTVESYLQHASISINKDMASEKALGKFRDNFPSSHRKFFDSLQSHHRVGPLVFVHAGLRMDVPLKKQVEEDMYWIRGSFLNWKGQPKSYLIVHGHSITPNFRPEILKHRIGIDTGSYREKGCITAAVFESNKVRFISSGSKIDFQKGPFA